MAAKMFRERPHCQLCRTGFPQMSPIVLGENLKRDNGYVHRVAASKLNNESRATRDSVCNIVLSDDCRVILFGSWLPVSGFTIVRLTSCAIDPEALRDCFAIFRTQKTIADVVAVSFVVNMMDSDIVAIS